MINTEERWMQILKHAKTKIMEYKAKIVCLVFTLLLFFNFGCSQDMARNKKESIAIVTLLYNLESSRFPPPPPPAKGIPVEETVPLEPNIKQEYLSDQKIYKKKYAISLNYTKEEIKKKEMEGFSKDFKDMLSDKSDSKIYCITANLNLKDEDGNEIPIIKDQNINIGEVRNQFDVLGILHFSEIIFNHNLNKGILIFGAYRHGLDGHTSLIALEKKNGKWEIVKERILSIS